MVWSNFFIINGILDPRNFPYTTNGAYYGVVSPSNVVGNTGAYPAEIDSPGSNFTFLSAYFTDGFVNNLNIEVQGFSGTNLVYDETKVASASTPTLFTFNFSDIDRLYFTSFGGEPPNGYADFIMDNFEFEYVPEPSSLLLSALGAVSLVAVLRRKCG